MFYRYVSRIPLLRPLLTRFLKVLETLVLQKVFLDTYLANNQYLQIYAHHSSVILPNLIWIYASAKAS